MSNAPDTVVDIPERVSQLFGEWTSGAPGIADVLEYAGDFAWIDRDAKEIVVDRKALLQAAVLVGAERREERTSSNWLIAGLGISPDIARRLSQERVANRGLATTAMAEGCTVVLSQSIRASVVPRALALSQATVDRSKFDLRHLLFALLEHAGREWEFLDRLPTLADLADARAYIVDQIGKGSESGELLKEWHRALGTSRSLLGEAEEDKRSSDREDRVRAQRDEPSQVDHLGRGPFAEVIAARLAEVYEAQRTATGDSDRAFFVHLDGPWGSGKSSVLNLIQKDLREREPAWLIVQFNAWREQKNLPPWWALMSQFVRQVRPQLGGLHGLRFRAIWALWNWRSRYVSLILALSVLVIGLLVFRPEWTKANWQPKDVLGLLTTFGAVVAVFRTAVFGSGTTAKAIEELRGDPYAPVMAVFKKLVKCADRPILVIVDDIDRCDGAYVVTLLENIQTMLRAEPISYIVARDRKWITASFEKRYADFCETLSAPGRPLGHLFLDKLFQLSVSIPRIDRERLVQYWQGLLQTADALDDPTASRAEKRQQARSLLGGAVTQEAMQRTIDTVGDDPVLEEEVRAEAARRIASPAAGQVLESRYAGYAAMLDPNPRAMKRLVNAIGISQAVLFLEKRKIDPDVLGRWTVLEMRWPQLAMAISANRVWLDAEPGEIPAPFDGLLASADVRSVLAGIDKAPPLDRAALNLILRDG